MINPPDILPLQTYHYELAKYSMPKLKNEFRYFGVATEYAYLEFLLSQGVEVTNTAAHAPYDMKIRDGGKDVYVDVKALTYESGKLSTSHTVSASEYDAWQSWTANGTEVVIASFSQLSKEDKSNAEFLKFYDVGSLFNMNRIKKSVKNPGTFYFYVY